MDITKTLSTRIAVLLQTNEVLADQLEAEAEDGDVPTFAASNTVQAVRIAIAAGIVVWDRYGAEVPISDEEWAKVQTQFEMYL